MTRTVTILSLLLALSFAGCKSAQQEPDSDQVVATVEHTQAEVLLQQIDRKYEDPEAHYPQL